MYISVEIEMLFQSYPNEISTRVNIMLYGNYIITCSQYIFIPNHYTNSLTLICCTLFGKSSI